MDDLRTLLSETSDNLACALCEESVAERVTIVLAAWSSVKVNIHLLGALWSSLLTHVSHILRTPSDQATGMLGNAVCRE